MALTKITRGVIKANENYDTHNINSTGIVTAVSANFTGDVSIGGTLTYQDVTNIDSVGVITARNGLHVTSGSIGIGTISPSGPVHAHVASGTQRSYLEASAAHSFLRLKSGSTSYNSGVEFFSGASNIANINGLGAGGLQFEVNGSERLRITSGGLVGIGTDIPESNSRLHTFTTQTTARTTTETTAASGYAGYRLTNGTGYWEMQVDGSNQGLRLLDDGTERLRIDSSGNLTAVNTSSGGATTLKVGANATSGVNNGTVIINNGGTGDGALQFDYENSAARAKIYVYRSEQELRFDTAGSERLRIKNNGTVHIGDAFEGGGYLNVYANNVENGIDLIGQISGSNQNSNSPKLRFQGHAQSNGPWIQGINVDGYGYKDLVFGVNRTATNYTTLPTETARFTQDGRFMVNTTSSRIVEDWSGNGPQGRIQIEQTNSNALMSIISAGNADANRAGTLVLGRHRNSTVGGTPTIVQSGDTTGAIVFAAGDGSDMRSKSAIIRSRVGATPGSSKIPGDLLFLTTNTDDGDQPEERLAIDHRASFIRRYPRLTTSGVYNAGTTRGYNSSATGTVRLPGSEGDTFYFSVTMPSYYASGSIPQTVKASIQYATYHASGYGSGEYLIHQKHGANGGRRLDVHHFRKLSEVYAGGWYYGMNTNFTTRLYETTNDEANASIVFRVQVRTGNGSTYDGSAYLHIKIETLGGWATHPEPRITWHGTSSPSGLGGEVSATTLSWP